MKFSIYWNSEITSHQKDDPNYIIPETITIFRGANSTQVARRWVAKDIRGLNRQLERAFKANHWFSMYSVDSFATKTIGT